MPTRFRELLHTERSAAEWGARGLALAGPYLAVGLVWLGTHTASFRGLQGLELVVPLVGSVVLWPALLFANVCLT